MVTSDVDVNEAGLQSDLHVAEIKIDDLQQEVGLEYLPFNYYFLLVPFPGLLCFCHFMLLSSPSLSECRSASVCHAVTLCVCPPH